MKFKVGDKIKCIKPAVGLMAERLTKDTIYEVQVCGDGEAILLYDSRKVLSWWSESRFVSASEQDTSVSTVTNIKDSPPTNPHLTAHACQAAQMQEYYGMQSVPQFKYCSICGKKE